MIIIIKNVLKLLGSFFICSLGIIFMINADLGLAPWDVLHQGVAQRFNLTMGNVSIIVGFIVVVLDTVLGEKVGWATILNMIFIGVFMDVITFTNIVPNANGLISGIIMLIIGMILMAIGSTFYLGCAMGSGPRDGLMVALQKKTNKPVKIIRGCIEISALIVGYILGGSVGIGTIITAFGLGHILQIVFKIFNFRSEKVIHRSIIDDINLLKAKNN